MDFYLSQGPTVRSPIRPVVRTLLPNGPAVWALLSNGPIVRGLVPPALRSVAVGLSVPIGAEGTRFVPEHAGEATLVAASVDQLPLFALVKWHAAAWTARSACFTL